MPWIDEDMSIGFFDSTSHWSLALFLDRYVGRYRKQTGKETIIDYQRIYHT
jgi:hypothetical protein